MIEGLKQENEDMKTAKLDLQELTQMFDKNEKMFREQLEGANSRIESLEQQLADKEILEPDERQDIENPEELVSKVQDLEIKAEELAIKISEVKLEC